MHGGCLVWPTNVRRHCTLLTRQASPCSPAQPCPAFFPPEQQAAALAGVLPPVELVLQQQGLEAGEGGADAQVDLLAGIHRLGLVFVWQGKVGQRTSHVGVYQGCRGKGIRCKARVSKQDTSRRVPVLQKQ
jgi:hypothetical protein